MTQYINKSALVAEIKERIETYNKGYANGDDRRADALDILLHDLDTLEVKKVDLEKEIDEYTADNFWALEGNNESPYLVEKDDMLKVAKHFFELGLKAQKGE